MNFRCHRFEKEVILLCVKWYLSYQLSYRNLEEMMTDRGASVDHTSIYRWVIKFAPEIEKKVRANKSPTTGSWRMDETYVKINGEWNYLYRAVDSHGDTIDFYLSKNRDKQAAKEFFKKAIQSNGTPKKVNIDKSGSNKSALDSYNKEYDTQIEIRQCKYMNNIVEQDHRHIKRHMKAAMGFKNFTSASITIAGIEAMRMIKKGQVSLSNTIAAQNFWTLCRC